jgi:hypothetical protein
MTRVVRSLAAVLSLVAVAPLAPLGAQGTPGSGTPIPPGIGATPHPPAARILVVDPTPGCRFASSLQQAVDLAGEGDILLVRAGTYSSFTIDGKSLAIFAEPGSGESDVRNLGVMNVVNLGPRQSVVVRGIRNGRVKLADNEGPVWLEGCRIDNGINGIDGLHVNEAVGVFGCTVTSTSSYTALRIAAGSTFFTYGSFFRGQNGRDAYCPFYDCLAGYPASPGGPGVLVNGLGQGYFFGSELRGGSGGSGSYSVCYLGYDCGGPSAGSGASLTASTGSAATLMDSTLSAPPTGLGLITTLNGMVGQLSAEGPVVAGSSVLLDFTGPAGWNVFLTHSTRFSPQFVPDRNGYAVSNPDLTPTPVGTIGASGTLQVNFPVGSPSRGEGEVLYLQAKLYDPVDGRAYYGAPSALLVFVDPCP